MILKNALVILAICLNFNAFADDEAEKCKQVEQEVSNSEMVSKEVGDAYSKCQNQGHIASQQRRDLSANQATAGGSNIPGGADPHTVACLQKMAAANQNPAAKEQPDYKQCVALEKLAGDVNSDNGGFAPVTNPGDFKKESLDKKISCRKIASFTADYDGCLTAINLYNTVVNSEAALNVVQTVQTQNKNAEIQKDVTAKAQSGDLQTAAFDAGIAANNVQKDVQQQKMVAFGTAVAALTAAINQIPNEDGVKKKCAGIESCVEAISTRKNYTLANQDARAALMRAAMEYGAKAVAAGIAMKQYDTAAQKIEEAAQTVGSDTTDMMVERCAFNPADPACKAAGGPRVEGAKLTPGQFSFTGAGGNAFDMTGTPSDFGEIGNTPTGDSTPVASINSPFKDEAARARDIINPAPPAQAQGGKGAAGGAGPGGVGGAMGGGGATLGSDLNGTNKEGDKEAQIKASKVSGVYSTSSGGGGFKAVAKSKDAANPFASLFDQKSKGGVVEDRSIASGDIDGAASGLFQKISKRYSQIQADKRIEANNLE